MSVREDEVRLADGSRGVYGVVDKPDFALVIPRDDDGGLWIVEHYRYPVRRRAWEFPQGSWATRPRDGRRRSRSPSFREETGRRADDMRRLGHRYGAYGFCSQGFDGWLATGLREGEADREPTEQDMLHRRATHGGFRTMVEHGAIVDAATRGAYSLLPLSDE